MSELAAPDAKIGRMVMNLCTGISGPEIPLRTTNKRTLPTKPEVVEGHDNAIGTDKRLRRQ